MPIDLDGLALLVSNALNDDIPAGGWDFKFSVLSDYNPATDTGTERFTWTSTGTTTAFGVGGGASGNDINWAEADYTSAAAGSNWGDVDGIRIYVNENPNGGSWYLLATGTLSGTGLDNVLQNQKVKITDITLTLEK